MRTPALRQRPLIEDIERRILFAADTPGALAAAVMHDMASQSAAMAPPASHLQQPVELVVLDERVAGSGILLEDIARQAGAGRHIEVVRVGAQDDAIDTISAALAGRGDVAALHIVSHGGAGRVLIGREALDDESLLMRAGDVAGWGSHLQPGADILLYGCDVAADAAGRELVQGLAHLTGADVAASSNRTGAAILGGDWTLEWRTGAIQASTPFSADVQARWRDVLATYTVTTTSDSGAGSLRQAILDANASPGLDTIAFDIPGSGVHTITPASALPAITQSVVIDGTTDAASVAANGGRPAIVIDGNGLPGVLQLFGAGSSGSTVRGLVIQNYSVFGLLLSPGSNANTVAGNFIGAVGANGEQIARPSGGWAIRVESDGNLIGGASAGDRNVLGMDGSASTLETIGILGSNNQVIGNRVGMNATGTAGFTGEQNGIGLQTGSNNRVENNEISGNLKAGIAVNNSAGNVLLNNRVGINAAGTALLSSPLYGIAFGGANGTVVRGNWIGGATTGILVVSASSGAAIQGNRIGTDQAGTANWGSRLSGIEIANASNVLVGGAAAGQGNLIARSNQAVSTGAGIRVQAGTGNALLGNEIRGTAGVGLGIDLGPSGLTANDAGDADAGANNLQNFPILSLVRTDGAGAVELRGNLNTTANSFVRIEFFANASSHASGYGEGQTYLGFVNVATDASGNAAFATTLAATVVSGALISATATRATDGTYTSFTDTSEFARNVVAIASTAQNTVVVNTAADTVDGDATSLSTLLANKGADGLISLREAITAINNTPAGSLPTAIHFDIAGTGVHTITLASALPQIVRPVVIDGTTDSSFAANGNRPAIVIDANAGANRSGLVLASGAGGSTLRGLSIVNFTQSAVAIQAGADGNTIVGNYLGGLTTAGTLAAAPAASAVLEVASANNRIGGSSAADRNVITPGGAAANGLALTGSTATGNVVQGNHLGTDAAGTVRGASGATAIAISGGAAHNLIGGAAAGQGNVLASQGGFGVVLTGQGDGNVVQGNRIGVSATGTLLGGQSIGVQVLGTSAVQVLDNWIGGGNASGIQLAGGSTTVRGNRIGTDLAGTANWGTQQSGIAVSSSGNLIGGTVAGQGNIIANANQAGGASDAITVSSGTGNAILGNRIDGTVPGNGALGIDLGADGTTANDLGDLDAGANDLQNVPVLTLAKTDGAGQILLAGQLDSLANAYFRIELFANANGHASGHGEGQVFLGSIDVSTDGAGHASFSTTLSRAVPVGQAISATATRADASFSHFTDTSEFAANLTAGGTPNVSAPTAVVLAEDSAQAIVGISIDNPGALISQVQLQVQHGTLSVDLAGGADVSSGASGSSSLTLTGTTSQLNAALASLTYQGTLHFAGSDTLDIVASDASGQSDADHIAIQVTNVNEAPTGEPLVVGTPSEGLILAVDASAINDADGLGMLSYQWLRNGVEIAGATGSTHLLGGADVGQQISVRVSYTDGQGTVESLASDAVGPVANVNDAPTGAPAIVGAPTEGQVLTVDTSAIADADGLGSFSIQWLRNGMAIAGASGLTYVPGHADVDQFIGVRVAYIDGHGTAESLTSADAGPVANVNDAPTGLPRIMGTPTENQSLTVDASGIADADGLGTFSFQWLRNGVAIAGATGASYTLGNADVGEDISLRVDYIDGHGTAESLTSAPIGPVADAANQLPAGTPVITGVPAENETLAVDTSAITDGDGLGSFGIQWLRNGAAIVGATGTTLVLGAADVGQQIGVRVNYLDGQGHAESLTADPVGPVANVNDAPTGIPVVTGIATELQTLSADATGIADADGLGTLAYQWLRNGVAIAHANGSTYLLGNDDVGQLIAVRIDYTDAQGTAESLTSGDVGPVANVNDAPTGLPVIVGTPTRNQTLSVDVSGVADADGLGALTYQWQRNGVAIAGANSNTYLLGGADVGQQVSVSVAYVDGHGTAESLASSALGPVAAAPNQPATGSPVITGTPAEREVLTVDTSAIADADGLGSLAVQWLRDGLPVLGATGSTYVLASADLGSSISVRIRFVDGGGNTEERTSAAVGPVAPGANRAPVLSPAGPALPAVISTDTANTGQMVGALLGSNVTDADSAAPAGIAVIAQAPLGGIWQYLLDGAVRWEAVGPVSETSALLLRPTDRLRLLPDSRTDATATISYRAWDQTVGAAGSRASTLAHGGDTAFSVATDTARVAVVAINRAPVFTRPAGGPDVALAVDERTTSVTNLVATDPDGDALVYSIVGGADATRLRIDGATGRLSFISAPDHGAPGDADRDGTYHVNVRVSDGRLHADLALHITVRQVPLGATGPAVDIDPAPDAVAENAPNGTRVGITVRSVDPDPGDTVRYALIDSAGGRFAIDATTGVVTVADGLRLDHEDIAVHRIMVQAFSSDGSAATLQLEIAVMDVNDVAPTFVSPGIVEVAPTAETVLLLAASDLDTSASSLRYAMEDGPDARRFVLDDRTGVLRFAQPPAQAGTYVLKIGVTDGRFTTTQLLTVRVIAQPPAAGLQAPDFTGMPDAVSVPQTETSVATVMARDPQGMPLTYRIAAGADAAQFTIDPRTGELRFATPRVHALAQDADRDNVFEVVVQASNGTMTAVHTLHIRLLADGVPAPVPWTLLTGAPAVAAHVFSPKGSPAPSFEAGDMAPVSMTATPRAVASASTNGAGSDPALLSAAAPSPAGSSAAAGMAPIRDVPGVVPAPAIGPQDPGTPVRVPSPWRWAGIASGSATRQTADADPGWLITVAAQVPAGAAGAAHAATRAAPLDSVVIDAQPLQDQAGARRISVSPTLAGGVAIGLGAAFWLSRSSALLASVLAASPAWTRIDPLPVLQRKQRPGARAPAPALLDARDESTIAEPQDAQAARDAPVPPAPSGAAQVERPGHLLAGSGTPGG